ncbi:hypothetical protein GGS26DRAFT_198411 [Hypomontagnella submonticulosa]|nr:hypothetical protein GGS26DRAFT_198411 [Hypomontagnella submonticulosa]
MPTLSSKLKQPQPAAQREGGNSQPDAVAYQDDDQLRDVPQSLLFPHSLDTAAPGRKVLLRCQRVLVAPPVVSPVTMISENSVRKEMGERKSWLPAGSSVGVKYQRMKDNLIWLKRTMTPEMFPHAWIMFVIIIALVASVVAAGWWGIIVEAKHHRAMPTANSSAPVTITPAEPMMAETISSVVAQGGSQVWTPPQAFVPATMVESMDLSLRSNSTPMSPISTAITLDPRSDPLEPFSLVVNEYVTVIKEADGFLTTTVYVTVTVDADPQSESSPTSTSTSTRTSASASTHTSIPTSSSRSTAPSISTTVSTSSMGTTVMTATTSAELEFCPRSDHPNDWTLCTDSPTAAPAIAGPGAISQAVRRGPNPLSPLRLGLASLWAALMDRWEWKPEAKPEQTVHPDSLETITVMPTRECDCEALGRSLLAVMQVAYYQRYLIAHQQELLEQLRVQTPID